MARVTTAFRCVAIVLLLAAVIMPPSASASGSPRLCNQTNEVVHVAIAWWGADRPGLHSKGWFKFTPGECAQIFPTDSYDSHRYYYAESQTGVWKGNAGDFCVHPTQRFEMADAYETCPAPYERRGFRVFSDDGVNLTL